MLSLSFIFLIFFGVRGLCKKLHWNWSYFSTSVDQLIYQIHLLNFFQQWKPRVLDKGRRVPLRLVFCVDHSFWGQVGWREREMERDWIGKRKIIWLNSRWSVWVSALHLWVNYNLDTIELKTLTNTIYATLWNLVKNLFSVTIIIY